MCKFTMAEIYSLSSREKIALIKVEFCLENFETCTAIISDYHDRISCNDIRESGIILRLHLWITSVVSKSNSLEQYQYYIDGMVQIFERSDIGAAIALKDPAMTEEMFKFYYSRMERMDQSQNWLSQLLALGMNDGFGRVLDSPNCRICANQMQSLARDAILLNNVTALNLLVRYYRRHTSKHKIAHDIKGCVIKLVDLDVATINHILNTGCLAQFFGTKRLLERLVARTTPRTLRPEMLFKLKMMKSRGLEILLEQATNSNHGTDIQWRFLNRINEQCSEIDQILDCNLFQPLADIVRQYLV